jgi:UDP-glucose 4-epimerase
VAWLTPPLSAARTLVTGGAGFIGGELVATLLDDGAEVTILDDLSTAEPDWRDRFADQRRITFIEGDAADSETVRAAMAGHDRVVHLASGTDIAGGFERPWLDFRNGIVATEVVCEAMRAVGARELWYASSGVVYGRPARVPTAEGDGPLLPDSHYAAAKLAGEAIVSGFAHLYGWRAFAFRFGNTVGRRSNHGVVHDLVVKLLRDPSRLEILGDGTPAKPYVAVADLVAGMRHAASAVEAPGMTVLNVGPEGTVSVRRVAEIVIEALALEAASVAWSFRPAPGSSGGGWPGDTALVDFDTGAMRALGWAPSMAAVDAIRDAAAGIAARYEEGGRPLVTSMERRASAATRADAATPSGAR